MTLECFFCVSRGFECFAVCLNDLRSICSLVLWRPVRDDDLEGDDVVLASACPIISTGKHLNVKLTFTRECSFALKVVYAIYMCEILSIFILVVSLLIWLKTVAQILLDQNLSSDKSSLELLNPLS